MIKIDNCLRHRDIIDYGLLLSNVSDGRLLAQLQSTGRFRQSCLLPLIVIENSSMR